MAVKDEFAASVGVGSRLWGVIRLARKGTALFFTLGCRRMLSIDEDKWLQSGPPSNEMSAGIVAMRMITILVAASTGH